MIKREWDLRRNCAIAPRQLGFFYVILCATSMAVAIAFTLRGAWFVLLFAVLEMSAVAVAFLIYARHATDREHIAMLDDYLLVELIQAQEIRQFKLDLRSIRIAVQEKSKGLIGLEALGTRVEVGQFLTEWKRREFVRELKQEIQRRSLPGA
ncbi:DUF2244 domain-containing protein [Collimonas sp.]|jgi:uncharacterized membrane protein|uniref:DUF2244 domain-containing protein n=1 Tax=Collimonas sp. TaxID=1963772 RepID=UPI002C1407F5|nr:DUF2244 domain-containing protein [Collimonas sp.]HWW99897.1 DUF2244 domain-containing protein [Collimonas sp.]